MDNKNSKRGFSGLSDLASDISGVPDVPRSEPSQPKPIPTASKETGGKVTGSPQQIETVGSGKGGGGSGWKWTLGIFAAIFVIWLVNIGGQVIKQPSHNPPPPAHSSSDGPEEITSLDLDESDTKSPLSTSRSRNDRSTQGTLAQEIENGRMRAKRMETQIKDLDDRLEDLDYKMQYYQASDMIDEYNELVTYFNSLVSERNELYEEYIRLIDDVNSKVRRYNSGYR